MRTLRLVGLSADGSRLVLADDTSRYDLAVDDALVDQVKAARAALAAVPQEEASTQPPTPRQVQERIRRGETAADIARSSGMPVEAVARYEGPVLAERAYHARLARRAQVGGRTVEELLEEHVQRQAQVGQPLVWDSWLVELGTWEVLVRCGRVLVRLLWEPTARRVSAVDEAGRRALGLMPVEQDALQAVLRPVAARALLGTGLLDALEQGARPGRGSAPVASAQLALDDLGVASVAQPGRVEPDGRGGAATAVTGPAVPVPGGDGAAGDVPAAAAAPAGEPSATADGAGGAADEPVLPGAHGDAEAGAVAPASEAEAGARRASGGQQPSAAPVGPTRPADDAAPVDRAAENPAADDGAAAAAVGGAAGASATPIGAGTGPGSGPAGTPSAPVAVPSAPAPGTRSVPAAGTPSVPPAGTPAVPPAGTPHAPAVPGRPAARGSTRLPSPADLVALRRAEATPLAGPAPAPVPPGTASPRGTSGTRGTRGAAPESGGPPPSTPPPITPVPEVPATAAPPPEDSPDAEPSIDPPVRPAPPRPPRPGGRQGGGRPRRAQVPAWDDISGGLSGRPPRRGPS